VEGRGGAGCGGGEGGEAVRVVVEERWELWVYGDGAFVLEVSDLDVEAFNLSVELGSFSMAVKGESENVSYEGRGFLTQTNLLVLDILGFVEICHDILDVGLFFGVRLACAVGFQELLNAAIAGIDDASAFLDDSIFGLDLLQEMGNLGR